MNNLIRSAAGMAFAGLLALGVSNTAMAQAWPGKPIRIVIAQALGSATDVVSRVVGNRLG